MTLIGLGLSILSAANTRLATINRERRCLASDFSSLLSGPRIRINGAAGRGSEIVARWAYRSSLRLDESIRSDQEQDVKNSAQRRPIDTALEQLYKR